jgi:hypothetical protein
VQGPRLDDDHVGALAGAQGADLALEAEGAGAAEGGDLERLRGRQRRGAEAPLLQERGEAQLEEPVEVVVARGAVGADGHGDAGGEELGDGRQARAELEVRRGAVGDVGAGAGQLAALAAVDVDAVREDGARPADAEAREAVDVVRPEARPHERDLVALLRGVGVEARARALIAAVPW